MLLSSFLKCSINFSKRCFSPQTWNTHFHHACEIPNKYSKIRCRHFSIKNYFQNILFFSPLHYVYFSSKLANSQIATRARTKADPGLFCMFSWYFEIYIKCVLLSLVIFACPTNIFSLHSESQSVAYGKRTNEKPTIFLFYQKSTLKLTC